MGMFRYSGYSDLGDYYPSIRTMFLLFSSSLEIHEHVQSKYCMCVCVRVHVCMCACVGACTSACTVHCCMCLHMEVGGGGGAFSPLN